MTLPTLGDVGAGHVLGRYELLLPLASGGMAMVWAARLRGTRGFQKIVAIKTMLPKLSEDEHFEQMFLDEAGLASQIRHPHVVEIMDLGEHDGVLYLVMEWIEGVPLHELLKTARKSGGVPLNIGVRIVIQALAGLHAAHELRDPAGQLLGLVHRDISPQNILVTYDGVAKVLDFGVAKATALGDGATAAGQIKGKVAYMAPEQVKGNTIDRRVDVFAMGIVLYAMTTGRHPFRKENEGATLYNICAPTPPASPRKIIPGYPATLERVVMQALAKDPAKRYPTANDMLRDLDHALPGSMRASTDEEVANFVRGIFGERREVAKRALAEALKMADNRIASGVSLRKLLDSTRPPAPTGSTSEVSSAGPLSASGQRAVLDAAELSGEQSLPEFSVPDVPPGAPSIPGLSEFALAQPRKRRPLPLIGGLLGAVALMVIVAFLVFGKRPATNSDAKSGETSAAAPPTPREETNSAPASALADAAPSVEATALPSLEPEPAPDAVKRPPPKWVAPQPAPTAKPKPGWRHDPGF